jgi:ABC-type sugar transport system substrate-binding protein
MKRRSILVVAALAAIAVIVATTAAQAGRSSMKAVPKVFSVQVADTTGEWVKYNRKTCKYEKVKSLGTHYKAVLRKEPTKYKIAYGPEDQVLPFLLRQNKSIKGALSQIGVDWKLWDNEAVNPAAANTKPVQNAQQIAAYKPRVVLWMNVYSALTPVTMKTFNQACIPVVQFDISPDANAVFFGSDQKASGVVAANFAAKRISARGWDLSQTWIVVGGQVSAFGTAPGSAQERVTAYIDRLTTLLPGITKDRTAVLDCPDTAGCRSVMADWLTAHPQAKFVTGDAVNDQRALGMQAALKAAGFSSNALIIGIGEEPAAVTLIDQGDTIYQGTVQYFPERRGLFAVPLAQDIANDKPVPKSVYVPLGVYSGPK